MAFSEKLAGRVRTLLAGHRGVSEKRMFGGIAFLLRGNMCCGVHGEDLMVRLAPEETEKALSRPGVRVFDLTGRPMTGWILVGPHGTASAAALRKWVGIAEAFAGSLAPKG